jgi:hypothetical protein
MPIRFCQANSLGYPFNSIVEKTAMSVEKYLFPTEPNEYGDLYRAHLLEQYKLYVELMDRNSSRRQSVNTFFVSINTALIAFTGFAVEYIKQCGFKSVPYPWSFVIPIVGLILCYIWYRVIRSYKDLNTGKFVIIHSLESRLPAAMFNAEWTALGEGHDPKKYLPFTHIEIWVPGVFGLLYLAIVVILIIGIFV